MSAARSIQTGLFLDRDMTDAEVRPLAGGTAAVFSARSPDKPQSNEDAAAMLEIDGRRALLAVCDGLGGMAAGERASRVTVETLIDAIRTADTDDLRGVLLGAIDDANDAVQALGVQAGTTLVAADIAPGRIRSYHVGDSHLLVTSEAGRLRYLTVAHSPVGYAVQSGLLGVDEAMFHENRHLVSNMVGAPEMSIEVGPRIRLESGDTVLLGTDGLFDNLRVEEIVAVIRSGPLAQVSARLAEAARTRMVDLGGSNPSKPDDLTFVLYRPSSKPNSKT